MVAHPAPYRKWCHYQPVPHYVAINVRQSMKQFAESLRELLAKWPEVLCSRKKAPVL
jgi:peptidase E